MTLHRRQALGGLAALAAAPFARAADAYPSKPIRIIVPFGPGGIADLTARSVSRGLGQNLHQTIIVENRPGAGGVTAGEYVARSAPDGYTLLLMSNGTAVSSGLFRKLPFDPVQDFAPISLLGTFDMAIVVPAKSRFRKFADLLAYAKANPGKLNIATVAIGSTQNLAAELLKSTTGLQAQVVPYNGTGPVITALMSGDVDAAVEILGPVKPHVEGGTLRALAVLGDHRPPGLPNVPTAAESGGSLRGFNVASWNALAAPARTPREIVLRLNRELQSVLAAPEMKKRLADINVEARSSTPEQLRDLLASEIRRWSDVIARAHIPRQ
jgi:tripartite-type tricarboxylate transporter receptor subunit TctC